MQYMPGKLNHQQVLYSLLFSLVLEETYKYKNDKALHELSPIYIKVNEIRLGLALPRKGTHPFILNKVSNSNLIRQMNNEMLHRIEKS